MCINTDCHNPIENHSTGECATCGRIRRKAETKKTLAPPEPINKVSDKMARALSTYTDKKARWIKNKRCALYPSQIATQIHHMMGRVGYADDYARKNNIPLLIDERYWLPVCHTAHQKIELNPNWAKAMGYSKDRLRKNN